VPVTPRRILGADVRSAASVPAASVAANVVSYALLLSAAHAISRNAYGQLSSLLGLLLIGTVPMLALQTIAARRAATDREPSTLTRPAWLIGLATGVIFAAASPAVEAFLRLPTLAGPLLVAGCVPGLALLGCAQGIAQGHRRFGRLAWLIVGSTGLRSFGGLVGLGLGRSVVSTLIGTCVATTLTACLVNYLERDGAGAPTPPIRDLVVEVIHAAHAHGAFLLLTSLDVLLARHILSADDAGTYAVGAVITRASLWAPQSIVMLAFASLAQADSHRRSRIRATLAVSAIGLAIVAATALTSHLVVSAVGGGRYGSLAHIAWLFALLGAMLATLQLSVLAGLARRHVHATALLWLTIVADVAVVLTIGSRLTPESLVVTLVLVTSCTTAGSVLLASKVSGRAQHSGDHVAAPEGQGAGM
jgi:O-antigen/teichoic acid export membrane protein